jgi:predicted TIM-barrel fold metal-dependent hydrolase
LNKNEEVLMKPERIIDMHSHVLDEDGREYAKRIAKVADQLNIEKIVMLGIESTIEPEFFRNDNVLRCYRECPDLVLPFAGISAEWKPDPSVIDKLKEEGFVGLKFILPKVTYHDESLYPWYQRAEELGMPVLFHLGIVSRVPGKRDRVDNNLMRPVYLDTIARSFPDLTIFGAHLGNPWYDEACMSCRWNPNLYFDLSGSTLKKKSPEYLGGLLWWGDGTFKMYSDSEGRGAWEKIVFGSDVYAEDIHDVVDDYRRVVETLELSDELSDAIFFKTAERLLVKAKII